MMYSNYVQCFNHTSPSALHLKDENISIVKSLQFYIKDDDASWYGLRKSINQRFLKYLVSVLNLKAKIWMKLLRIIN